MQLGRYLEPDNKSFLQTVLIEAPAKINLILRVIGRRDDGYHELETWMQKVSLHDRIKLSITKTGKITFFCSGLQVDNSINNLVYRAAVLFLRTSARAHGIGMNIELEKNIPISAGLGGGSSDAGSLFKTLNSLFGNEFSLSEMIEIGTTLGADVPFFLSDSRSVLATGVGEKLTDVTPLKDYVFLLVNPGIPVSTAEIFKKFALTRVHKNSTLTGSLVLDINNLGITDMQNDLEEVTLREYPVIDQIKTVLHGAGADGVLMSGSGPTVFGVFQKNTIKKYGLLSTDALNSLRRKFGEHVYIVQ